MKKLLITVIILSPFSFADWGDTYFCTMTHNSFITPEGESTNYILENFKFNMNADRQEMVFGNSGLFANDSLVTDKHLDVGSYESWWVNEDFTVALYHKNKFSYSQTGYDGTIRVTANCDKF